MAEFSSTTPQQCQCCGQCTCSLANTLPEPEGCGDLFAKGQPLSDPYNRCGNGQSPKNIDEHVTQNFGWDYKWCQIEDQHKEDGSQCGGKCIASGDCSREDGITYIPAYFEPGDGNIIRRGSIIKPWWEADGWEINKCIFDKTDDDIIIKRGGWEAGVFWPASANFPPSCDQLELNRCNNYGQCLVPCYDYMECAVDPMTSYCEEPPCDTSGTFGNEPNRIGGPLEASNIDLHVRKCGNQQGTCMQTGEMVPDMPEYPETSEECLAFSVSQPGCAYPGGDSGTTSMISPIECPGYPEVPLVCLQSGLICELVKYRVVDSCELFIYGADYLRNGIKSHAYDYCAVLCHVPCDPNGCGEVNHSCCPDIDGQTYIYDEFEGCIPCEN